MPSSEKPNSYWANEIARTVCPRYFKTKGYKTLPAKFWNDVRFAREYKLQVIKAYSLLKIYSPEAILNALKSKEGIKIYSLTAQWLDGIIAAEEKKLEQLQEKIEQYREGIEKAQDEPLAIPNVPRPSFSPGKSVFDKLS